MKKTSGNVVTWEDFMELEVDHLPLAERKPGSAPQTPAPADSARSYPSGAPYTPPHPHAE